MAQQRDKNAPRPSGDDRQEDLERALQPEHAEDLLGQMEENTNLTGSTTWETLGDNRGGNEPEAESEAEQRGKRAQRAKPGRSGSAQNPPRTTTGDITSPKFGAAGSGGAELEPGPERD